jgi:hypothetical protein
MRIRATLTLAALLITARSPALAVMKRSIPKAATGAKTIATLKRAKLEQECVLSIQEDLVEATFLCRPSKNNKSPYVGDIRLADGSEAIAHLPSMDMGGKMYPGVRCMVKPARDRKGVCVSPDAKGKFGTPKCEYIMQLMRNVEAENDATQGCWVGAHPRLGEEIVASLLDRGLLQEDLGPCLSFRREVCRVAGADMRSDFLVCNAQDGEGQPTAQTVVEVKLVVDTDYDPGLQGQGQVEGQVEGGAGSSGGAVGAGGRRALKGVFFGPSEQDAPYQRAAIFPWGKGRQKGPEGEKVVSARAIRHVMELTSIACGEKVEPAFSLVAAVVFIVVRSDALLFRPNHEACPSFAKYLQKAHAAGVKVLAYSVGWGEGDGLGKAFFRGKLPLQLHGDGEMDDIVH